MTTQQWDLTCAGCGGPIHTTLDAVQHAGCHQAGDLAEGPRCAHLRPILRLAGVDLPTLSCIRAAGHSENLHRGVDRSEWSESIPDWWEQANEQVGDILAALIRLAGADEVKLADHELARRAPDEVVRIEYDDHGAVRVQIITEVSDAAE